MYLKEFCSSTEFCPFAVAICYGWLHHVIMMKRSLSNLIYLEIDDAKSERPNPEEVAGPAAGLPVSLGSHETHKIPHSLVPRN